MSVFGSDLLKMQEDVRRASTAPAQTKFRFTAGSALVDGKDYVLKNMRIIAMDDPAAEEDPPKNFTAWTPQRDFFSKVRRQDVCAFILNQFRDPVFDARVVVSHPNRARCRACDGSGELPMNREDLEARGFVWSGQDVTMVPCVACQGEGFLPPRYELKATMPKDTHKQLGIFQDWFK